MYALSCPSMKVPLGYSVTAVDDFDEGAAPSPVRFAVQLTATGPWDKSAANKESTERQPNLEFPSQPLFTSTSFPPNISLIASAETNTTRQPLQQPDPSA